jgi:hypothetical protein
VFSQDDSAVFINWKKGLNQFRLDRILADGAGLNGIATRNGARQRTRKFVKHKPGLQDGAMP